MLIPILAPLAAVSVLGFALGAADATLEGITPQRWTRWRAAELAVCALAAAVALLPTLAQADDHTTEALRNLAGLGGLTALGVVALGARVAWVAPTAYAFAGAAVGPRTEDGSRHSPGRCRPAAPASRSRRRSRSPAPFCTRGTARRASTGRDQTVLGARRAPATPEEWSELAPGASEQHEAAERLAVDAARRRSSL